MDRGSTAQAYCGGCISLAFLTLHMRTYPFVNMEHNHLKMAAEVCTFFVMFTSIVLKADIASDEFLDGDSYGWIMSLWVAVVVPITAVWGLSYRYRQLRQDHSKSSEVHDKTENPLASLSDDDDLEDAKHAGAANSPSERERESAD